MHFLYTSSSTVIMKAVKYYHNAAKLTLSGDRSKRIILTHGITLNSSSMRNKPHQATSRRWQER